MVGSVKNEAGVLFDTPHYVIVKKVGIAGDAIPKHNHPEAMVVVTIVKGKVKVLLNDNEEYLATAGDVLTFDGDNYIQPTFVEDGEFVVNLVQKVKK